MNFNDNKNFYPTPEHLIRQMIAPLNGPGKNLGNMQILEPSAGSGNILDYLFESKKVRQRNLYAIEQDPDLVHILQSKGYKVIANDFLDYHPDYSINCIIANPPYDKGDEHLLHMWEILHSGEIVCLLNAETVRNPFSQKRKLLVKLIEDYGSVEWIGKQFQDAERKTAVDSCIVRLSKEAVSKFAFKFINVTKETKHDFSEEIVGNSIAINDVAGNLIRCYEKTKDAFVQLMQAKKALEFYSSPIMSSSYRMDTITEQVYKEGNTDESRYNIFLDEIKLSAWQGILNKMNIQKYLTYAVLSNFHEFAKNQGALDLTKENIHNLIMMIVGNRDQIMTQAVMDVFDLFTRYHSENREHVEGWKTNEAWIVGERIILPGYIQMGYGTTYNTNHAKWQQFQDIEKVMCYLSGIDFANLDQLEDEVPHGTPEKEKKYVRIGLKTAINRVEIGAPGWHQSEFFQIRCFKKGTIHLKWSSEELRAKFNQIACKGKFNLGYSTKKKKKK